VASVLRRAESGPWIPAAAWSWWGSLIVFVTAYLAGDLIRGTFLGPNASPLEERIGTMVVQGAWTIGMLVWLSLRHPGWGLVVRCPANVGREVIDGCVYGLIVYGVIGVAVALPIVWLTGAIADVPQEIPRQLPRALRGFAIPVTAIDLLIVAPIAEELFFRGVFYRAIRDRHGVVAGVSVSALLFALFHTAGSISFSEVYALATTFALGVALAAQYERRRNLVAPIAAHAAFNLTGMLLLLR